MSEKQQFRLGLVGYGEIGSTLGQGLREAGWSRSSATTNTPSTDLTPTDPEPGQGGRRQPRALDKEPPKGGTDRQRDPRPRLDRERGRVRAHLDQRHTFVDFASATPKVKRSRQSPRWDGARLADGSIMGRPLHGYRIHVVERPGGRAGARSAHALGHAHRPTRASSSAPPRASRFCAPFSSRASRRSLTRWCWRPRVYGLDEAVLASASKTLTRPFMDTVHSLTPSGVIDAKRRTEEVEMAAEAVEDAGIDPADRSAPPRQGCAGRKAWA